MPKPPPTRQFFCRLLTRKRTKKLWVLAASKSGSQCSSVVGCWADLVNEHAVPAVDGRGRNLFRSQLDVAEWKGPWVSCQRQVGWLVMMVCRRGRGKKRESRWEFAERSRNSWVSVVILVQVGVDLGRLVAVGTEIWARGTALASSYLKVQVEQCCAVQEQCSALLNDDCVEMTLGLIAWPTN